MTLDQLKARAENDGKALEKLDLDSMLAAGDFIEWDTNCFVKIEPRAQLIDLKVCQAKGVLSAYRMMVPEDTEDWNRHHCADCADELEPSEVHFGVCEDCLQKQEMRDAAQ